MRYSAIIKKIFYQIEFLWWGGQGVAIASWLLLCMLTKPSSAGNIETAVFLLLGVFAFITTIIRVIFMPKYIRTTYWCLVSYWLIKAFILILAILVASPTIWAAQIIVIDLFIDLIFLEIGFSITYKKNRTHTIS
ncbi:MAG: hypothetical protein K2M98_06995, partial [Muribaculum sp.]|nr:hypothetical protein [Muribaculum sp.]